MSVVFKWIYQIQISIYKCTINTCFEPQYTLNDSEHFVKLSRTEMYQEFYQKFLMPFVSSSTY